MDAREIAVRVAVRRREWARQAGTDHWEGLDAFEPRWRDEIADATNALLESLAGRNELDPQAAALDVLAVTTALIEQMGEDT